MRCSACLEAHTPKNHTQKGGLLKLPESAGSSETLRSGQEKFKSKLQAGTDSPAFLSDGLTAHLSNFRRYRHGCPSVGWT